MRFWRSKETQPETNRGEMILARKPIRATTDATPRSGAPRGLLEVVIPRQEVRRTHQRGEERRVLRDADAVVTSGGRSFPAPVSNISSNGVMIDCRQPLTLGEDVSVAIGPCEAVPMTVRWIRAGRIGLEFPAETTILSEAGVRDFVIDVIRRENAAQGGYREAVQVGAENRVDGDRHQLMWLCELTLNSGSVAARIRNISARGAMVSFDEPARPFNGERVHLAMGENVYLGAEIRWRADGMAGMVFDEPFPVEHLIEQPCARIVEPEAPTTAKRRTYASKEEAMRIEYTGLARPYDAPDMDYQPLTLRELYTTLYGGAGAKR